MGRGSPSTLSITKRLIKNVCATDPTSQVPTNNKKAIEHTKYCSTLLDLYNTKSDIVQQAMNSDENKEALSRLGITTLEQLRTYLIKGIFDVTPQPKAAASSIPTEPVVVAPTEQTEAQHKADTAIATEPEPTKQEATDEHKVAATTVAQPVQHFDPWSWTNTLSATLYNMTFGLFGSNGTVAATKKKGEDDPFAGLHQNSHRVLSEIEEQEVALAGQVNNAPETIKGHTD